MRERNRLELRVSDTEREHVAERLRVAAGDGRLTLEELEQRLEGAYGARTYGELEPLVGDLPVRETKDPATPRETAEIKQTGTSIVRRGRWVVPQRLVLEGKFGSTVLDFSQALINHSEVEIVLAKDFGATRIIVPKGAAVDTDELEMAWGAMKNKAAAVPAHGSTRFRITGTHQWGSLTIRHPRRYFRWFS